MELNFSEFLTLYGSELVLSARDMLCEFGSKQYNRAVFITLEANALCEAGRLLA